MADAVERALDEDRIVLCEAGTGTGKTLAYLVPALLSGRRVVVSTASRALQEQIAAMTPQEVSKHLTAVAKARNKMKRDDDPELFDRLKKEFDLLMARMREKR